MELKLNNKARSFINMSNFMKLFAVLFRFLIVVAICYIILFPLITKVASSFMSRTDIWDQTVNLIPRNPTLVNYTLAFEYMDFTTAFLNSFILAFVVSLFQLLSCTLIGYGFASFDFKGKNFWFFLVIFSLVIPPELIITPLYLNFRFFNFLGLMPGDGINLIGTNWPFILLAATGTGYKNGLFIYIMRQFFKGMPKGLAEAAYVDGAGPFRTFFKIMLPGAVPGMVIVFLFSFVWQWNDYFLTTMFVGQRNILPLALEELPRAVLGDQYLHLPEEASLLINTGSLMIILPLVLLYIFLQKYFVESVQRSGIK
ncbi:carbohydrate ABC transporter permease [Natronospora cellulosivora (SeqCode)]